MAGDKGAAKALVRTPAQKAAATRAEKQALEKANAQRLAQVVNLHIAGFSLAEIGQSIGATADEVDRMLTQDTARYVKSQPALRVFVRNYISGKFTEMLEADWDEATDKNSPHKLENQDRAMRILDRLAKLHGADAPTQTEVKVDAAPEAVEKMVQALAASKGVGYDVDVFDIVDAEIVHDAVEQSVEALLDAGERVGESSGDDEEDL